VTKVGFDWPSIDGVYEKLHEEVRELQTAVSPQHQAEELGDLLFVVVNLAKWLDIDAESALREANAKFSRRFKALEKLARHAPVEPGRNGFGQPGSAVAGSETASDRIIQSCQTVLCWLK
jgi:uncharacterized protein YabN with tetrapyrrole methylase and pyrophosphatase domain